MLGEPSLITGEDAGDAKGEALLAKQRVPAVPGTVGPDLAGLGEVGNILVFKWSTGPFAVVALAFGKGLSDGVETGNELPVGSEQIKHFDPHPGHDHHVQHDVGAVGNLDTDLGDRGAQRSH